MSTPVINSIFPASCSYAGGTSVTITGTGFTGASAVMFGNTPATSFQVNSDTQIVAVAPAGPLGITVFVTVKGAPLPPPANITCTVGSGTLPTGTYYYRVTSGDDAGETTPSAEVSLAITGPAGVSINWDAVAGATWYGIYGRSSGGELYLGWCYNPPWLDDGSSTPDPSSPPPTMNATGPVSNGVAFQYYGSFPEFPLSNRSVVYGLAVKKTPEFSSIVQRGINGGPALVVGFFPAPIYHYEIPIDGLTPTQLATLRAFYEAVYGQLLPFPFTDPETNSTVTVRFETDQQEFDRITMGRWSGAAIKLVTA